MARSQKIMNGPMYELPVSIRNRNQDPVPLREFGHKRLGIYVRFLRHFQEFSGRTVHGGVKANWLVKLVGDHLEALDALVPINLQFTLSRHPA